MRTLWPQERIMQLAIFDIDTFLRDHWQKGPALIRNPWDAWSNPLTPDELAGLACEEGVESRLVACADGRRLAETGPLPEARFSELGRGPWTLLVQAVDHHVPAVAALIAPFRFVPDWRIDDVMVSYATDGGGVGPHFDQYDVFLIQGLGRRRWRVGPLCDARTPLMPHEDLRLIADFEPTHEWILEPGDILYVPPGYAHDGVAVGDDCMTYSIGFRAPARSELIEGWCAHQADLLADDDRYADPDLTRQANAGEIAAPALDRLFAMVAQSLSDRDAFARWFGSYTSQPKYPEMDWQPEAPIGRKAVRAMLAGGVALIRNPGSRFAFIRQPDAAILLFVDGQCHDCTAAAAALAEQICAQTRLVIDPRRAATRAVVALVEALIDQGSLAFDLESDDERMPDDSA
jgi:50S ribosomal protein L16 3-hydroxylase